MSLISTAGSLGKAFKNAGRVREILSTMTRFGFGEFVQQIGVKSPFLQRVLQKRKGQDESKLALPVRLRRLCEELGPTFVKLGQVLAGRPDLVPENVIAELQKLQDQVERVPFDEIKVILEVDLGRPIEECFSSLDTEALATASIAQVHSARTLEGDDVVVKVKKPGVDKLLKQDLEIIESLASLFERYIPELRPFKPSLLVREFQRSVRLELDFEREVINMRRFRKNFLQSNFLVIPKPYADLCSPKVITMERLRGVKLHNVAEVRALGIDPAKMLHKGVDAFFQSILIDGLFHADPHGGNILALPDGRMALLDFGSVGWLSTRSKDALVSMMLALLAEDYAALVMEYTHLAPPEGNVRSSSSLHRIQAEVSAVFSPYWGLSIAEIPLGKLLLDGTRIAMKHNISVPVDLVLVFRAIMTLEGIGRSLDPEFDLTTAGYKYAKIAVKERYSPERLGKDFLFSAKNWSRALGAFPTQAQEVLRKLESGELQVESRVPEILELAQAQRESSSKVALSILASTLLLASLLMMALPVAIPAWSQTLIWVVTCVLVAWLFLRLLKRPFS